MKPWLLTLMPSCGSWPATLISLQPGPATVPVWKAKPSESPALQGEDPVGGPAAENGVGDSTLVHEHLVFSERQFRSPTEVNHLADVEVGQRVVKLWTKPRIATAWGDVGVGTVQQVACIAHR